MRLALLLLALPLWGQTIDAGSSTDSFFTGGTPWVIAPPGSTDATLRYGVAFKYKIPAKGVQVLTLRFREPIVKASYQRIFTVHVNNQPMLQNFDLFAEAGFDKLIERGFVVVPADGFVEIRFSTNIRSAVVSSISLQPLFPPLQIVDLKWLDPYSNPPFEPQKPSPFQILPK